MERRNNNPHHSTADLLSWSQSRFPAANRSNQPSDDISDVLGGSQITREEAQSLNNNVSHRRNCSGHKLKEMGGSDIFSDFGNVVATHTSRIHYHQDQHSQINFSGQETPSPKKPTTLAKAAKQKELSRTQQAQPDSATKKKQMSNCNIQATTTHDIFASPLPPESQAESTSKKKLLSNSKMQATHDIFASPLPQQLQSNSSVEEPAAPASVKATSGQSGHRVATEQVVGKSSSKFQQVTSSGKRISNGKLTSNGIFKSDKIPPGYSEKMHSSAKLREMSGHNIFADGKSEYRDYYGGTRRPPGGESSISLV